FIGARFARLSFMWMARWILWTVTEANWQLLYISQLDGLWPPLPIVRFLEQPKKTVLSTQRQTPFRRLFAKQNKANLGQAFVCHSGGVWSRHRAAIKPLSIYY